MCKIRSGQGPCDKKKILVARPMRLARAMYKKKASTDSGCPHCVNGGLCKYDCGYDLPA